MRYVLVLGPRKPILAVEVAPVDTLGQDVEREESVRCYLFSLAKCGFGHTARSRVGFFFTCVLGLGEGVHSGVVVGIVLFLLRRYVVASPVGERYCPRAVSFD